MIKLTIRGKEYTAPQNWKEITLQKFIELCDIEIPEKLRQLWVASAGESDEDYKKADEAIGVVEIEKTFPEYYGKVIKCLTDIPEDVIDLIHGSLREQFFNKHLRHYIYSIFANLPVDLKDGELDVYEPPKIEHFELDGVRYQLPITLSIYGDEIPMAREKAITFAEASDIEVALRDMAEGAANRIPMLIAIYCRPDGEEYDESKVMARADKFQELPMDIVWAVFFYMYVRLSKLLKSTHRYSKSMERRIQQRFGSLV